MTAPTTAPPAAAGVPRGWDSFIHFYARPFPYPGTIAERSTALRCGDGSDTDRERGRILAAAYHWAWVDYCDAVAAESTAAAARVDEAPRLDAHRRVLEALDALAELGGDDLASWVLSATQHHQQWQRTRQFHPDHHREHVCHRARSRATFGGRRPYFVLGRPEAVAVAAALTAEPAAA